MTTTITNYSVPTKYTDQELIKIFSSPRSEGVIINIIKKQNYDCEKAAFWSLYYNKFDVFKTLEKQPKIEEIVKDVLQLVEKTMPENADEIKKFINKEIVDSDEKDIESQTDALKKTQNNGFHSEETQKAIDELFLTDVGTKFVVSEKRFSPLVSTEKPEIREDSWLGIFMTDIRRKISNTEELAAYFESKFKDRNLKKAINKILADAEFEIKDKKTIFEALASKKNSKKIFEEFELLNFYRVFLDTTHHDVSTVIQDNFSQVKSLNQLLEKVERKFDVTNKYGLLGNLIINDGDENKRIFRAVLKVYFNEIRSSLTSEETINLLRLAFASNKAWVFKKLNLFPTEHIKEAYDERIFHDVDQTSLNAELKKVLAEVLPLLERQYEVKQ